MGGNAFTKVKLSRIKREDINATLRYIAHQLNIPCLDEQYILENVMGSAGKQPDSGDLDIALDAYDPGPCFNRKLIQFKKDILNLIADRTEQLFGKEYVIRNGMKGGQLNTAWPIAGDPTRGYVQVDFIFGPAEWLKFTHYSPGKDFSPYKGVFISTLLGVMSKVRKDFEAWEPGHEPPPGFDYDDPVVDKTKRLARVGLAYDLEKGLYRKWELRLRDGMGTSVVDPDTFETKAPALMKRYGLNPNIPRFSRIGYINNPDAAVRIILGPGINLSDIDTFEKLVSIVKSRVTPEKWQEIKRRTIAALWHSAAKNDYENIEALGNLPVFEESILESILGGRNENLRIG